MSLAALIEQLRAAPGLLAKRDIQPVAQLLGANTTSRACGQILNGDDAAAIVDGDGYTLIAAEGMLPSFVAADPWFAGFCAVLVNVSDIAAMGGRAYALVDVLFSGDEVQTRHVLAGMHAAALKLGVPVVGGHTSRFAGATLLAASIVGRAKKLITSFDAQVDDQLLFAVDLRGAYRAEAPYFDAATGAAEGQLRRALDVLPALAESGLCRAGKDVSMAGIAGTLVMLCEGSGVGAVLRLDDLPVPAATPLERWLTTFPSFGYLLAVAPGAVDTVCTQFQEVGVTCAAVGHFQRSRRVELMQANERQTFWDLAREPLTGFGAP